MRAIRVILIEAYEGYCCIKNLRGDLGNYQLLRSLVSAQSYGLLGLLGHCTVIWIIRLIRALHSYMDY